MNISKISDHPYPISEQYVATTPDSARSLPGVVHPDQIILPAGRSERKYSTNPSPDLIRPTLFGPASIGGKTNNVISDKTKNLEENPGDQDSDQDLA